MKIDFYSKIILTIIAVCLLYMVGKDMSLVRLAHAQAPSHTIPQQRTVVDVNLVSIADVPFNRDHVKYIGYMGKSCARIPVHVIQEPGDRVEVKVQPY